MNFVELEEGAVSVGLNDPEAGQPPGPEVGPPLPPLVLVDCQRLMR